jgi:hypothetical protein
VPPETINGNPPKPAANPCSPRTPPNYPDILTLGAAEHSAWRLAHSCPLSQTLAG